MTASPRASSLKLLFPSLLWLGVVVFIVAVVLFKRGSAFADDPPARPSAAPSLKLRLAPSGALPLAPPASGPAPSAMASAPAPTAKGDDKAKSDDKGDQPIDYASVDQDGGVPVHEEGNFRSPFAHPRFGPACNVRVGFLLADVTDYEIQKGTFQAEFFMSLTSDKPMPTIDLDFINGKIDDKEVTADKPTFKLFHFVGTFQSPPDLHDYPFDTQELTIELEDNENGTDQIHFVPDRKHTSLDVGFSVAGWDLAYVAARVVDHYYPDRFDHDDLYYGRYRFILGIKRFATSAVFTVFVPALVIVIISLSGLWLPREVVDVRSNATTPMLAAAVLFHFALMQGLPATSYLTRADKMMMAVYACLAFHMVLIWLWFVFDKKHEERIFQFGKWYGPPITFAIIALGMVL